MHRKRFFFTFLTLLMRDTVYAISKSFQKL